MEEGLIIGYDLCKDFCRISYFEEGASEPKDLAFSEEENPYLVQNSICKKKGEDLWLIGQEAYESALLGTGTIVDKLLRFVAVSGSATFEGVLYSAEELLAHFLSETLEVLFKKTGKREIREIVYSVQELNSRVLDAVIRCTRGLGIDRKKIHIISHTESYLFYVLSQRRELWSNLSILYDLSGDGLNYYELEVLRGQQPNMAKAERTFLEEGFSLDILESASGCRMADSIMTSCVDRMLSRKLISSCYLSGKGMESCQEWGKNFLKILCSRRKVFFIENLFAKGAVYAACDHFRKNTAYPYRILCEGRISVEISLDVCQGVNQKNLVLARAGDNWYETRAVLDFIPDQENTLRMKVKKMGERLPVQIEVPLTEFLQLGNKRKRIRMELEFIREDAFRITLRDKGFGEFFPAGDTVVQREFTIG